MGDRDSGELFYNVSFLEAKLWIDANAIGNEEERVWYGFRRLTDVALRRIHPWIEFAKGKEQFTVVKFLDRLDRAFDDPQKITKAINKLNSIQQENCSFREFLQDFEQTLLEAQAWEWTDDAKKGYLQAVLKFDLTNRLLRTTSNKMKAVKAWDAKKERNHSAVAQLPSVVEPQEKIDVMDWKPSPPVNVSAAHRDFNGKTNKNLRARAT
ncbi:hypothetical protein Golomagni_01000 [Golovinomyces magnicellulatus]|nr:hypothetical protein Golomagni_01000 [Golovinomyces magnicellulatus]